MQINLDPVIGKQLAGLSEKTGQGVPDLIRRIVHEYMEDLADIEAAEALMAKDEKEWPQEEVARSLGIDPHVAN